MRYLNVAALVVACAGLAGIARADDTKNTTSRATGTWKWTAMLGNRSLDFTLELKQDGDSLSGSIKGPGGGEAPIEDGKVKDGEVTFKVNREGPMGGKLNVSYKGKLTGDTIKGVVTLKGPDDQLRKLPWTATRAKE